MGRSREDKTEEVVCELRVLWLLKLKRDRRSRAFGGWRGRVDGMAERNEASYKKSEIRMQHLLVRSIPDERVDQCKVHF